MKDLILIIIIVSLVVGILLYLRKVKKRGETCVGCPYAKECAQKRNGGCCNTEK